MVRIAVVVAMLMFVVTAWAQDTNVATQAFNTGVNEVALLAIEGSLSPAALQIVAPSKAGAPPENVSTSGSTLNYTAIVDASETKTVKVKVDSNVPAGCTLSVAAAACASGSEGAVDADGAAKQALTTSDADFLTGIGSCYTGDGSSKGNALTYYLDITNWGTVASRAATSTTITFTLSATD